MAHVDASRVLETFTTTGTGTVTLAGALIGYRAFASAMSNSDTCWYFMEGGSDWEIGYGTYSGGTLARTTVLKSSNANAAVDWAAGTKTVGIAPLGSSDFDATNLLRLQALLQIVPSTYTPTLTNVANLSASTANVTNYLRVGNIVLVAGLFQADAVAAASTSTQMGMSLPIASALTSSSQLGGAAIQASGRQPIEISADATNDRANFFWLSQSTANENITFSFMYRII